jgi:hypothetical protein
VELEKEKEEWIVLDFEEEVASFVIIHTFFISYEEQGRIQHGEEKELLWCPKNQESQ